MGWLKQGGHPACRFVDSSRSWRGPNVRAKSWRLTSARRGQWIIWGSKEWCATAMSHKSDPSKPNDVSEDSAPDSLQTEPSTSNAVSVESEAISHEVDAFLMAEKMSPPASMGSMGFGEIPIMPASAPPSSSGMKGHGSADKSDHNDISGMLTIGPPVTVGTKRKASDVALDPMSNGALDPANSKVLLL